MKSLGAARGIFCLLQHLLVERSTSAPIRREQSIFIGERPVNGALYKASRLFSSPLCNRLKSNPGGGVIEA